jgi:filamentous hemagglutinin family protein
MSPRRSHALVSITALVAQLTAFPADAGPTGGSVGGGSATIQGDGTGAVTINQTSHNAIINWQTFNIGKGETATFVQPGSTATALNRVIGGLGPSRIDGTLSANGRLFIINGDGVLFGPHAVITTAGFLASTNDICQASDAGCNQAFVHNTSGNYNFNVAGRPGASIVNLGNITATSGGFAALVAPGVRNAGTISATLGTVSLAAGNAFTLDFYGDRLITLAVNDEIANKVVDVATGKPLRSLVENAGALRANGGRVEVTAATARKIVDSVINNTGVIEANSVGTQNGMIVLGAATESSKRAGAPTQTVRLSGRISVAGKQKGTSGGTVVVTGENIELRHARIDASGDAGGGKVLIGGDTGGGHPSAAASALELAKLESFIIPTATTVSMDARSTINASAIRSGNGGKVVLWSDRQTTFAGTILARGGAGSGNGGFIETSSHRSLAYTGTVDLRAPNGKLGTVLLDPSSMVIDANCSESSNCVSVGSIQNGLANGNFIVQTGTSGEGPGNITVDSDVSGDFALTWGNASTLTLSAFGSIVFQSGASVSNSGAGNLVLRADNTGTGTGTVSFGSSHQVDFSNSTGTVSIY